MNAQNIQQSNRAEPKFFYGYVIVAADFLIMAASWGSFYAFGIFFKPVLAEFGWTRAMISGAFSFSMIVRGLLGIVMGGLSDRFGPRVVVTFCGFMLVLGYLLMSQINSFWQLYLFYGVIIGIGMSGVWVPLLSTVARWFTKKRGMFTGIVVNGLGIGMLVGPPVASHLISTYDWRISYIILGVLVLIVVIPAAQFLRYNRTDREQAPYSESKDAEQHLKLGAGGFSLREAIYTRQFWLISVQSFCRGFFWFAIIVHIVPYAVDEGISTASAASILATIGGLAIVGRIVLGSAADRIGSKQALIIGFILSVAALLWLVPSAGMWKLLLFAAVLGFGEGGNAAVVPPLVAGLFGLRSHGLILGAIVLGYSIGAAAGPLLAGYMFDTTDSYRMAFLVAIAVCLIGLIVTVLLKPITGEREQNLEIT